MKTEHVRSMGLPKGIPVSQFVTVDEIRAVLKNDDTKLVDIVNLYGRQKTALVDGRAWLSEQVDIAGFKRLKKDGSVPTDDTEYSEYETEQAHLDRFAEAVSLGAPGKKKGDARAAVTAFPGYTPTGKDDDEKLDSAWAFLQAMLDKHGAFNIDLLAAPRVSTKKKLPDWALNGARNIIANKAQAKWVQQFTKGYTDKKGFAHAPVAFAPFDAVPKPGSAQPDIDKVNEENVQNLARAIYADETARQQAQAAENYA